MKYVMMSALLTMSLLLGGCGGQSYEPSAIEEGVDVCEVCNMMVEDGPFASQIILKDGQVFKFDDVGDLFVWKKQNGTELIGAEFVRDMDSLQWIPLQDAYFAYDKTFKTPMAYGVYAFADETSAKNRIAEEGKGVLMTASELDGHPWERNMDLMKQMKEMKHGHGAAH